MNKRISATCRSYGAVCHRRHTPTLRKRSATLMRRWVEGAASVFCMAAHTKGEHYTVMQVCGTYCTYVYVSTQRNKNFVEDGPAMADPSGTNLFCSKVHPR